MHEHTTHVHALRYCHQCDAVYCPNCGREWRASVTYVWGDSTTNGAINPIFYPYGTVTVSNAHSHD